MQSLQFARFDACRTQSTQRCHQRRGGSTSRLSSRTRRSCSRDTSHARAMRTGRLRSQVLSGSRTASNARRVWSKGSGGDRSSGGSSCRAWMELTLNRRHSLGRRNVVARRVPAIFDLVPLVSANAVDDQLAIILFASPQPHVPAARAPV